LLVDRNSLFSSVKIAGSVDIAESLAFVFRHLRWDAEADLANLVGDIPARRLVLLAGHLGHQAQESAKRLIDNMAEYAVEDSTLLAAKRDVVSFGKAIDQLGDDMARLEKRIARL
jgi:ubiquinone biosynthesis protein UbiJ